MADGDGLWWGSRCSVTWWNLYVRTMCWRCRVCVRGVHRPNSGLSTAVHSPVVAVRRQHWRRRLFVLGISYTSSSVAIRDCLLCFWGAVKKLVFKSHATAAESLRGVWQTLSALRRCSRCSGRNFLRSVSAAEPLLPPPSWRWLYTFSLCLCLSVCVSGG